MDAQFVEVLRWTNEQCREYLAAQRWPNGIICPKCGSDKEPYQITRKTRSKNVNKTLYKCRDCKRQFTATTGTIFEDSHVSLSKWFGVIYLMCASKKGISALQIKRMFKVHYRTAWFMCHRVREAMKEDGFLLSGTIEADETYIGGKTRRGHPVAKWEREQIEAEARGETYQRKSGPKRGSRHPRQDKAAVFGMIERGGRVKTMHIPEVNAHTMRPIMISNIDVKNSRLITDGHSAYRLIKNDLPHAVIDHSLEYVRFDDPTVHTQGIENYWSLVKRGILGTWHHVGVPYLNQYLREFDYRFNRRRISDEERFRALFRQTSGKRLTWYCQTPQPENPYA